MTISWGNNLTNKEIVFPKFNYNVNENIVKLKEKKILASENMTNSQMMMTFAYASNFLLISWVHQPLTTVTIRPKLVKLCWCCPPSLSSQSGTLCWTANSLLYLLPPHYYRRSGSDVTFLFLKKTVAGEYSVSYIYYGQSGNIWYLIHATHFVTLLVPGG